MSDGKRLMHVPRLVSRIAAAVAAVAAFAGTSVAQPPDLVASIAAENAALSAQIADGTRALDRASAELEALRNARRDLDESMQRIERRAKVHALGREFAQTLVERRRDLPTAERFAAAREARARLVAATSDANVRVERERDDLADLDAAAARRLAAAPPPGRPPVDAVAFAAALAAQRELLTRLAGLQQTLLEALHAVEDAERDLETRGHAAHAKLTDLLFWIPSPPGNQTLSELVPSLAWTVSPAHWRAAAAILRDELARRPFWPALALLAAAILFALRGRLQRALVSLAPAAVTYERYRFGHAMAALAITFALALPGPIVLWTAAILLGAAPERQAFARGTRRYAARRSPDSCWPCPPSHGCSTAAGWRSATSAGTRRRRLRRARPPPVHGALRAAHLHRRAERAGTTRRTPTARASDGSRSTSR